MGGVDYGGVRVFGCATVGFLFCVPSPSLYMTPLFQGLFQPNARENV